MLQKMNGEKIVKMEPNNNAQRITTLTHTANDPTHTEKGTITRQEMMESILNFGVMVEEINDLVQSCVSELMDLLDPNDSFECNTNDDTDVLIDKEDGADDDSNSVERDVLAFAVRPDHTALTLPLDCCFEAFKWFGDSEVCDPVPDCPGLYMTYDHNKIFEEDGFKCLPDSAVIFKIDPENNFIGMSDDDMLNTCKSFENMRAFVVDDKSGKKTNVFILA